MDMSATVAPKSDQINADDLIAGPRTIRIERVSGSGNPDQPVNVHFDGDGGKPFRPCKSMRRVMIAAWGADASQYPGRSMTLYRDPKVAFGGMEVGGIRISHMSHIERDLTMALTVTKAKRAPYVVRRLVEEQPPTALVLIDSANTPRRVSPDRWLDKMREVLGKLPDAAAVRTWRAEMGPHIAAVSEADAVKAAEAERLIAARLDELAPMREPGEDE